MMVDNLGHEQREQCDDGHIDQIVAYEDGSHQSLRLFEQVADEAVIRMLLVLDLFQVARTKREATSDAEINAERKSSINAHISEMIAMKSGAVNTI